MFISVNNFKMARNEEKQMGRLNRWILQQEKDEFRKKNPPRPKLHTLNTADEIKKWLPSIVRDIDINLQQSQVVCYTPEKIEQYRSEVNRLQRLYNAFLKKFKLLINGGKLDSTIIAPWTERGYTSAGARKRKLVCEEEHKDEKNRSANFSLKEEILNGGGCDSADDQGQYTEGLLSLRVENDNINNYTGDKICGNSTGGNKRLEINDSEDQEISIQSENSTKYFNAVTSRFVDQHESDQGSLKQPCACAKEICSVQNKSAFKRINAPILQLKGFEIKPKEAQAVEDVCGGLMNDQPLQFNHPVLRKTNSNFLGLDYDSSGSDE